MKNIIFYYCTPINDYKERFEKSLNKIKESGLYNLIDNFILLINGDFDFKNIDGKINKINLPQWKNESKAANFIKDFCIKNNDCNILYLHSKGVTKPNNNNVKSWIDFLEYFVILKHEDCINNLKNYNTCSANMSLIPSRHYSGNFWWAKSAHIAELDYCNEEYYHGCEMWPMSKGNPDKFYNFYSTNRNLYSESIHENEYKVKAISYVPKNRHQPILANQENSAWGNIPTIIKDIIDRFDVKTKSAIEFGVEYGYSTSALANYFDFVIGVDTFDGDIHAGFKGEVYNLTCNYLSQFKNVKLIKSSYQEYCKKNKDKFYDFAHVDIVHTYEDTYECGKWCIEHSDVVIFHDTISFPNVHRACVDLSLKYNMIFYNYEESFGLGILVKNKQNLHEENLNSSIPRTW